MISMFTDDVTPVCVGQGSASKLTAWRSTCFCVGQDYRSRAPGQKHQHCCRQALRRAEVLSFSKWTQDQKLSSGFMLLTFMTTEQYWLFRTWDLRLPSGLMLLTFMATHLFHVSFASACGYGKDQTTSNGYGYFFRSFVLYRPWIPGEHRRGICAVDCVTPHLRGFEEDSRSEVVFWIEEWSIEFFFTG